jgi:addiction module HigA family antidote
MDRIPTHRRPTNPEEMLLEEFLNPMSLTEHELADAIHVPYQRINDIIHGRRSVTPNHDPLIPNGLWSLKIFASQ